MWVALHDIADEQQRSLNDLITEVHHTHQASSLATALREYVVQFYRAARDAKVRAEERAMLAASGVSG